MKRGHANAFSLTLPFQGELRWPRVDVERRRRRLRPIGDGRDDEPRVDVDDVQRRVRGFVGLGVGQRRRRRLNGRHLARRSEPHDRLQVLLQVGERIPETRNYENSE